MVKYGLNNLQLFKGFMDIIFVDNIELLNRVELLAKKNNHSFNPDNCKIWVLVENNNIFGYLIIKNININIYKIEHIYILNKNV